MKSYQSYWILILLILVISVFLARSILFFDPDFGWHLKMGEIITARGIPLRDPFSYTMPSFLFVDHEWLTNIGIYKLHSLAGVVGLAVISVVLVMLTIIIASRGGIKFTIKSKGIYIKDAFNNRLKMNYLCVNLVVLLSLAVILPFFGIRPQVESWFFLSLLLLVLFKKGVWTKWKYGIPGLILIWTNMHGSFALGIVALLIVVTLKSIRLKKLWLSGIAIFLLSLLATFVNPYGARAWGEVWMQISDSSLRWSISEWMPAIFMLDISFISLLVLSTLLVFRYRKKFTIEEVGLYFVFLLQAILSRRHIPLWVVVALPMTTSALNFFYWEVKDIKNAIPRLKKFYLYAWIGTLVILSSQGFFSLKDASSLSIEAYYPKGAVSYLRQNLPAGEIFSDYSWGGYLIWNLPEKKVFIDGRMPSWRRDSSPDNESDGAFNEYVEILNGDKNYRESFEKYDVDTIVWPRNEPKSFVGIIAEKLEGLFSQEKETFSLIEQIEKDGWEKVYQDDITAIFNKL